MRETWVRSLGREDPLEMEMATHSSTLAWKIPWMEVHGVAKSQTWLSDFTFFFPSTATSFTKVSTAITAFAEWIITMIIIAQLIREQHLDVTYILLPNKAWGRTQRECGAWSRAPWFLGRLPFANLHSSAHHWCHELCFMQNDKIQTKNYRGDREASEYRHARQPRRNRFAYNLLIIQFLELVFFFCNSRFQDFKQCKSLPMVEKQ